MESSSLWSALLKQEGQILQTKQTTMKAGQENNFLINLNLQKSTECN